MTYEHLLEEGRIRRHRASPTEIERVLDRARRDLRTSQRIMAEDWDWGFAVAYNAVLQASRAYMLSRGFRAVGAEGHKSTFMFMREALGPEYESLIAFFDRMRTKRNTALYDIAGVISLTEAEDLLKRARGFFAFVESSIERGGGKEAGT